MQKESKKRSSVEKYKIKQILSQLKNKTSFNQSTSLVTIYIPPGTQLSDIANLLREEYGTASNIKDKNTGKAVQAAIQSILARLKLLKNTDNGLVIFCGQTDNGMEFYAIEPPEPVGIKQYVCDNIFHTEHLEEMLDEKDSYGLVVIDRGGATFAVVRGNHLEIVHDKDSFVPSKHRQGGQSAQRFERGLELMAQEWYNRMAELANKIFLETHPVKGIIVGGPAMGKEDFINSPRLDYRIKQKIIDTFDVGYTGVQGIKELLEKASTRLKEVRYIEEKELVQRFLTHLAKDDGKVTYGEQEVKEALLAAAADVVLVSEKIDHVELTIKCQNCGHEFKQVIGSLELIDFEIELKEKKCSKCGEPRLEITEKIDLVEQLDEMAQNTGARLEIISVDHDEGKMLYDAFGGIAAILRYNFRI